MNNQIQMKEQSETTATLDTNPIHINYEGEFPTVSGRELHAALEIKTAYKDWFPRMCEYGFTEGADYNPLIFERVELEGKREVTRTITDHSLTIPMAKELCMLQRNEKGKMFRRYFIKVEEFWNSPEMIMGRAMEIAQSRVNEMKTNILSIEEPIKRDALFALFAMNGESAKTKHNLS
ncbi:MAG: antA/AntB antirepressor family protein [Bacteroides sp.]|nr:antA/AntB antirepressor family protein [Eubacterium sp.]MCM1417634.1 antA/AntB antirepressor family protein [Roseburia sp.]MCM1461901.1 antA/AntB antirepressor family protein [Bacteroides sp.]